jgi:uncharacterized BrkB/YihY/UPF0761 family membrane protein
MLARIDAWQRRHGPAAFLVAVLKKFGEDRASSHAALIAYTRSSRSSRSCSPSSGHW